MTKYKVHQISQALVVLVQHIKWTWTHVLPVYHLAVNFKSLSFTSQTVTVLLTHIKNTWQNRKNKQTLIYKVMSENILSREALFLTADPQPPVSLTSHSTFLTNQLLNSLGQRCYKSHCYYIPCQTGPPFISGAVFGPRGSWDQPCWLHFWCIS